MLMNQVLNKVKAVPSYGIMKAVLATRVYKVKREWFIFWVFLLEKFKSLQTSTFADLVCKIEIFFAF